MTDYAFTKGALIGRIMMRAAIGLAALSVAACVTVATPSNPQDAFFARLTAHCGQAYAGALVSNEAADADMAGRAMIMHVRDCSAREIRIPFHVARADGSWDRSRTWVITRTATGLRLKHDHRHVDGSADAVTMYGGDTAMAGTATAQYFPVDAESIALFRGAGLDRSVTNVWTVAVDGPAQADTRFVYALTRAAPHARSFRVEFDLTSPVPAPPPPWGSAR